MSPKKAATMSPKQRAEMKGRLITALKAAKRDGITTKAEIARKLDISSSGVGQWFLSHQTAIPDIGRVAALARLLKVNVLWILSGEGEMEELIMNASELALIRKYQQLDEEGRGKAMAYIDGLAAASRPTVDTPFDVGKRR